MFLKLFLGPSIRSSFFFFPFYVFYFLFLIWTFCLNLSMNVTFESFIGPNERNVEWTTPSFLFNRIAFFSLSHIWLFCFVLFYFILIFVISSFLYIQVFFTCIFLHNFDGNQRQNYWKKKWSRRQRRPIIKIKRYRN